VDEATWRTCTKPTSMLDALAGKATARKLRLFAAACCRTSWHLLRHGRCRSEDEQARSRRAVEVAEAFAAGLASAEELADAQGRAHLGNNVNLALQALLPVSPGNGHLASPRLLEMACRFAADSNPERAAGLAEELTRLAAYAADGTVLLSLHADLLRCLFGPLPFRPSPIDLSWRTASVVALATTIDEERRFEDLPVLADALEESGCNNQDILRHCRQQTAAHARGCFVLALVLNKE
jgi:hypothetical protein